MLRSLKHKIQAFEEFTIDVILDRRDDRMAFFFAGILKAFSWLFSGIVQLRFLLYRKRIFRDQPLGCLVVVVGNLTVGGTGKTPVVEKFARALRDRGRKVAILSRGYKSKSESALTRGLRWMTSKQEPPPKIVSDGERVLLDSEQAGDEPFMLAQNLPGVLVLVDKNRVKAGRFAIEKYGCDTLLLDDGFQYLPLRGSLNLLLVDKTNPFGNGSLLPRGVLREPIKHLRRASYVFLTKSDGTRDVELEEQIRRYNPTVEMIECTHTPTHLVPIGSSGGREALAFLKGKRVAAFCGIAVPESFERFLKKIGAEIVHRRWFLDHHRFDDEDFSELHTKAVEAGAEIFVTTEKDAVRIPSTLRFPLPTYYLRLEIEILRGAADFQEAVTRICFPGVTVRGEGKGKQSSGAETSSSMKS